MPLNAWRHAWAQEKLKTHHQVAAVINDINFFKNEIVSLRRTKTDVFLFAALGYSQFIIGICQYLYAILCIVFLFYRRLEER